MPGLSYVDFQVDTAGQAGRTSPKTGPSLALVGRLVQILHGAFSRLSHQYALAFPEMREGEFRHPGSKVRVFAETREALNNLLTAIENHTFIRDYLRGIIMVKEVPTGRDHKLMAYVRHRIPGRKSYRTESRARRIAETEELPYLQLSSKSTSQGFSLHIKAIEQHTPGVFCPNSYGLATASKMFAVPVLE